MDISDTLEPKSDQLDAIELVSGPRVFTIEGVTRGSVEQPVNFTLVGFPRAWRPGKSMRRVLVACWGPDASQYIGRQVELFCDPEVRFGGVATGGTRISRLSHIDKPKSLPLLIARGKSAVFSVEPLPDAPAPDPQAAQIAALRKEWNAADPDRRKVIEAQVAELTEQPPAEPEPDPSTPAPMRDAQRKRMFALFNEVGIKDRDQRLAMVGDIVGVEVGTTNDLTAEQCDKVIAYLSEQPS